MLPCICANQVVTIFADDKQMQKNPRSFSRASMHDVSEQIWEQAITIPQTADRAIETFLSEFLGQMHEHYGEKQALLWYKEWKTFADESCKASRNEWTQQVQSIAQHRLSSAKKSEHSSDTDFDTRRFWKEKKSSKHRPAQTCTNALSWCIRTTCLWSMLFTWPKCNQVACHSNWFSMHLHLVLLHHSYWFVTGIGGLDCIGFTACMCSNKKVDVYHGPSPLFTVALFP